MSSALIEHAFGTPISQAQQIPSASSPSSASFVDADIASPSASLVDADIASLSASLLDADIACPSASLVDADIASPSASLVDADIACPSASLVDAVIASYPMGKRQHSSIQGRQQQVAEKLCCLGRAEDADDDVLASVRGLFPDDAVAEQQEQEPTDDQPSAGKEVLAIKEQDESATGTEMTMEPATDDPPAPPSEPEPSVAEPVAQLKVAEPPAAAEVIHPTTSDNNGWTCPACTFINRATRPGCEICTEARPTATPDPPSSAANIFSALMSLQSANTLAPNPADFECPVCLSAVATGAGALLQQCLHSVCRDCLRQCIRHSRQTEVACPFTDAHYTCPAALLDSEIRALISVAEYAEHQEAAVREAENGAEDAVHCRTPDCRGWCLCSDERVKEWRCEVCGRPNCLACAAIHEGQTCGEYAQEKVDAREQEMVDGVIRSGLAMRCPRCKTLVTKVAGCDYLVCTRCQEQLCWATRGPRWGPKGVGDTSGGCRCKVNGHPCHPNCQNCH